MKKILPRFLAVATLCLIFMLSSVSASPPGFEKIQNALASQKSETIYVSLDHSGGLENISVVNAFPQTNTRIVDYGAYQKITNLSNTLEPLIQSDKITFDLTTEESRSEPFYYEGQLSKIELPWIITLNYILDGKMVNAKQIAGKTGNLSMMIQVQQNPNSPEFFRENYLIQILIPFNMRTVTHLSAPEASQMVAGSTNYLSYIVLPQLSQSFVLSATIHDFEMEAIEFTALKINPLSIKLEGQGISSLALLVQGWEEIYQAMEKTKNATIESEDALKQFNQEIFTMAISATLLVQGLEQYEQASLELSRDLPRLTQGSSQFSQALTDLADGSKKLGSAYREMEQGLKKILEPKEKLREIASKYFFSPNEEVQTMAFALAALLNGTEKLYAGMMEANSHYESMSEGLIKLSDAYTPMNQGISQMAEGLPMMIREGQALFQGSIALMNGLPQLSQGMDEFYQGFRQLPSGVSQLYDAQGQILNGLYVVESTMSGMFNSEEKGKCVSFVSPEKNQVNSVQFIMRTQAIKAPKVSTEDIKQSSKMTFWQKLIALFIPSKD
jgi:putative membrane protein